MKDHSNGGQRDAEPAEQSPGVDWIDRAAAEKIGRSLTGTSPQAEPAEREELIDALREAALRAPALIAEAAHLPATAGVEGSRVLVVDRRSWVTSNTRMAMSVLERLGHPDRPRHLADRAAGSARAVQLGGVLGLVSRKVLGQYDPFSDRPGLLLVAPNVLEVERSLALVPEDFRLWVCLHEQTHRAQFLTAPWLVDHIVGLVRDVLWAEGAEKLPSILGRARRGLGADPDNAGSDNANPDNTNSDNSGRSADHHSNGALLDLFSSPAAKRVIDQITAVMSLLEGHADVMMDEAAPGVIATLPVIRSRFEQRRRTTGASAVFGRILGLDAKLAQYREGATFCRGVIALEGVEGLNLAWEGARNLPRRHELDDPRGWLRRVGG